MAQFQDLSRVLLAAGCATHPEGDGTYFLYTNNTNLTSKILADNNWGDQEILVKNVRSGSPAACLLSSSTKLIIYVTSTSSLAAIRYDEDDEEWYEDDGVPAEQLNGAGKLAGVFRPGTKEEFYIFFQDQRNKLICIDHEWSSVTLPANPLEGTPLCATVIDNKIYLFYVSDGDHCLHYLLEEDDDWIDSIMVKCVFDETLRSFTVAKNGDGMLEAYILTVGNVVLQVVGKGKGEVRELGRVDQDGKFIAGKDIEFATFVWAPIVGTIKERLTRPKDKLKW